MKKVSFYSVEFQVFQRVYVLEAETYINQNSETIIERKSTKIDLHKFLCAYWKFIVDVTIFKDPKRRHIKQYNGL